MKESQIIEFLSKMRPDQLDDILAGKKRWFFIRVIARITYRIIPFIYGICALIGWSLNPAQWGLFVRFVGVSLAIFIYIFFICAAWTMFQEAQSWLEQHGKNELITE